MSEPFWKTKTLAEMSDAEWESLCDGCGRCCLITLEVEETGELLRTDMSCRLFDGAACQCSDYANRRKRVRNCVKLTPENIGGLDWMPKTCAYKLLHEGKDLFWWHPLVSGDPETVHSSGASVRGKVKTEQRPSVARLMRRVTIWPDPAEAPPQRGRRARAD